MIMIDDLPVQENDPKPEYVSKENQSTLRHSPERSFRRWVTAASALLVLVLSVHLLERFGSILKPLLIACFLAYIIVPLHQILSKRGVPSILAYTLIVLVFLALIVGMGQLVYSNFNDLSPEKLAMYEDRLDQMIRKSIHMVGLNSEERAEFRIRNLFSNTDLGIDDQLKKTILTLTGSFLTFLAVLSIVFVYLLFLLAERETLPERLRAAFGEKRAEAAMQVVVTINRAIAQYIVLKTFVSLLQGGLSMIVLGLFGIEFFVMWGFVIFLFNFIPYIGSLIAVSIPVLQSFLQYPNSPWVGLIVLLLLLGVQRVVDNYVEPKLMGKKLGVSPLLVVLSLTFWGSLWGIVGMVLAVPLVVVVKIILSNIDETRAVATLVSDHCNPET
jgi:AI-2 transport protein TqsA